MGDIPGGAAVLVAAGFIEDEENYVLPIDAPVDIVHAVLDSLKAHIQAKQDERFRAERNERIAKEREIDAKLAEMGGFARGIHKLGSSSVVSTGELRARTDAVKFADP